MLVISERRRVTFPREGVSHDAGRWPGRGGTFRRRVPPQVYIAAALCTEYYQKIVHLAGPMDRAWQHFAVLGNGVPPQVNIADAVLDLVIRSPPSQVYLLSAATPGRAMCTSSWSL